MYIIFKQHNVIFKFVYSNFVIWSVITFISFHSIDAYSTKRLGRFANDGWGSGANAYVKLTHTNGNPHLCLFAKKHIKSGTEIRYDYNRRSAPWRVSFLITIVFIIALFYFLCYIRESSVTFFFLFFLTLPFIVDDYDIQYNEAEVYTKNILDWLLVHQP